MLQNQDDPSVYGRVVVRVSEVELMFMLWKKYIKNVIKDDIITHQESEYFFFFHDKDRLH